MSKDEKINIKLEVCRDKTSGKLSIMAHFNKNAPNIFKDKDGYIWMPTPEETDFLNEAFEILPFNTLSLPTKENEPSPKKEKFEEIKHTTTIEPKEKHMPKPMELDETDVFEVTPNDMKVDKSEKLEIFEEKNDLKESNENEEDKEDAEEILVEAEPDEIDAALRKHSKDESIREVDEQTIIDKVLSQKKKGKWSRK